jgi:propionate CoA-transferase
VFRLGEGGPEVIEIAPGADLESDVIAAMGFRPSVSPALKRMEAGLFADGSMGLASRLPKRSARPALDRFATADAAE